MSRLTVEDLIVPRVGHQVLGVERPVQVGDETGVALGGGDGEGWDS